MKALHILASSLEEEPASQTRIVEFVMQAHMAALEAALVVTQRALTSRSLSNQDIQESVRKLALGMQQLAEEHLKMQVTIEEG